MVFALFGQGRALPAFIGAGIDEENLHFGCGYLCGACSCQVKRENPGFDLPLNIDWWSALEGIGSAIPDKALPPLAGITDFGATGTTATNAAGGAVTNAAPATATRDHRGARATAPRCRLPARPPLRRPARARRARRRRGTVDRPARAAVDGDGRIPESVHV